MFGPYSVNDLKICNFNNLRAALMTVEMTILIDFRVLNLT